MRSNVLTGSSETHHRHRNPPRGQRGCTSLRPLSSSLALVVWLGWCGAMLLLLRCAELGSAANGATKNAIKREKASKQEVQGCVQLILQLAGKVVIRDKRLARVDDGSVRGCLMGREINPWLWRRWRRSPGSSSETLGGGCGSYVLLRRAPPFVFYIPHGWMDDLRVDSVGFR